MKQMQQMVTDILFLADLRGWKVKVHADYCLWCGYSLINHTRQPFIHYSLFVIHWSLVFGLWCLVFGLWSLVFGDSKIQRFKRFKDSKDSRIQKIQRFEDSKIQRIQNSRIQVDLGLLYELCFILFGTLMKQMQQMVTDILFLADLRGWKVKVHADYCLWCGYSLINHTRQPFIHYSLFVIHWSLVFGLWCLVFGLWSLVFGDSKIQRFKRFKDSKDSRIQKIQRFEDSKIQRIQNSRIQVDLGLCVISGLCFVTIVWPCSGQVLYPDCVLIIKHTLAPAHYSLFIIH